MEEYPAEVVQKHGYWDGVYYLWGSWTPLDSSGTGYWTNWYYDVNPYSGWDGSVYYVNGQLASSLDSSGTGFWNRKYYESGTESTLGPEGYLWEDVTTTPDGDPSSCAEYTDRCTMQHKSTNLSWTKLQSTGQDWNTAVATCEDLDYNGQTDWRLPTQRELNNTSAYGIIAVANENWISQSQMSNWFWSGTRIYFNWWWSPHIAYVGSPSYFNDDLLYSAPYSSFDDNSRSVVCVRP